MNDDNLAIALATYVEALTPNHSRAPVTSFGPRVRGIVDSLVDTVIAEVIVNLGSMGLLHPNFAPTPPPH